MYVSNCSFAGLVFCGLVFCSWVFGGLVFGGARFLSPERSRKAQDDRQDAISCRGKLGRAHELIIVTSFDGCHVVAEIPFVGEQ